jgi:hypothetical protein
MKIKDKSTNNPRTIANNFNKYLSVVDNIIHENIGYNGKLAADSINPITHLYNQPFTNNKMKHTTSGEIEKIIRSLKTKNSYGYDEISTKILKASAPYILSPLSYIGNRIISTGTFPDRLKFSEIEPLFKKGNRTNFVNSRPISLLFQKFLKKLYARGYVNI